MNKCTHLHNIYSVASFLRHLAQFLRCHCWACLEITIVSLAKKKRAYILISRKSKCNLQRQLISVLQLFRKENLASNIVCRQNLQLARTNDCV